MKQYSPLFRPQKIQETKYNLWTIVAPLDELEGENAKGIENIFYYQERERESWNNFFSQKMFAPFSLFFYRKKRKYKCKHTATLQKQPTE